MSKNSSPGFPIFAKYEIAITYKLEGKEYPISHHLTAPSAQDKIDYWRTMADRELSEDGSRYISIADTLEAACQLWDKLAQSVEGYNFDGAGEKWKELVPSEHKRAAVDVLLKRAGALQRAQEKN